MKGDTYENDYPKSCICQDQALSQNSGILCDCHLPVPDYYPSGGMDYSGLHYRSYDLPIISSDTIQTQRVEEMKEISDHIMRL